MSKNSKSRAFAMAGAIEIYEQRRTVALAASAAGSAASKEPDAFQRTPYLLA